MEAYKNILKTVLLEVNYECYLKCIMCNKHKWIESGANTQNVLNLPELKVLFSDLNKLGTERIILTGTEPVMRNDIIKILENINQYGMKSELYLTGIKLKDEIITAILDNSVDTSFSIDGFCCSSHNKIRVPDNSFDAFSITQSNINRLRSARKSKGEEIDNVRIMANFTVQKLNVSDLLSATSNEIENLNVDYIRMSFAHGTGDYALTIHDIQTLREFEKRISSMDNATQIYFASDFKYLINNRISEKDFLSGSHIPSNILNGEIKVKCSRGKHSTMIDPIGNVRGCQYLYDDNGDFVESKRDNYILGNIRDESIINIWHSDKYEKYRTIGFPNLSAGSKCISCEYMDIYEQEANDKKFNK